MEAFKAVEKEMKTKAFSKEGLNASAKMDPHEQEKHEVIGFLGDMIDELGRQVEAVEAELETLQASVKKAKKDSAKAERLSDLEHSAERHKWHIGRLELLLRAVENEGVTTDQARNAEEDIRNYVDNNQEVDFYEDEGLYDEFNLDEEEEHYGVPHDLNMTDSHDNPSVEGEALEPVTSTEASKQKSKSISESSSTIRRPSQHVKSPLPTLSTLHTTPAVPSASTNPSMKPAPPPAKPPGEPLKYASAAAAAAASDKAGIGIAPLPPPQPQSTAPFTFERPLASPSSRPPNTSSPQQPPSLSASSSTNAPIQRASPVSHSIDKTAAKSPIASHSSVSGPSPANATSQTAESSTKEDISAAATQNGASKSDRSRQWIVDEAEEEGRDRMLSLFGYPSTGTRHAQQQPNGEQSIYHLPPGLQDLVSAYEATREAALPVTSPEHQRRLETSFANRPDTFDSEKPNHYKPKELATFTPAHYPQEPLPIFDDPRLYDKVDTDVLFYSFYFRQGTYQQYLAAKALKAQSWRFHRQYQTWFQRLEEPKTITDEFEQGTYRFFDYESTW